VYINDVVKRAVTGQTQAMVTSKICENAMLQKVFVKPFRQFKKHSFHNEFLD
jgi:hypothetical protein